MKSFARFLRHEEENQSQVNLQRQVLFAFAGDNEVFKFDCASGHEDHPKDIGLLLALRSGVSFHIFCEAVRTVLITKVLIELLSFRSASATRNLDPSTSPIAHDRFCDLY